MDERVTVHIHVRITIRLEETFLMIIRRKEQLHGKIPIVVTQVGGMIGNLVERVPSRNRMEPLCIQTVGMVVVKIYAVR